jgi:predicted MPP superfamily phosphohydrolase
LRMTDAAASAPGPARSAPPRGSSPDRAPGPGTGGRRRAPVPSFARVVRTLVVWTVGWWALGSAVIHPWVPGGWWTLAAGVAAFLGVSLTVFGRAFGGRLYPGAWIRLLVFRPFWYVETALPLVATAGLVGTLAGWPFGVPGPAGRWTLSAVVGVLAVLILAGWVGSRRLVTRRVVATFPDLPADLVGLRIGQLSDLHVGPHTSREHLRRVRRSVEAAAPDVIVFTGDQVDDYPRDTEPFARAFAGLDAPLGVYAVAGNHDVYAGWPAVRRGLEGAGQRVLVNEAVALRRGASSFWLAGTGDPAGRERRSDPDGAGASDPAAGAADPYADVAPDLDATLAGVPAGAFVVVLAHNPVLWPGLADRGVPLTLSGHTHHGQLSVPRLSWSLASPFVEHAMGAHERDGALLYISPGTNYWGLPFRIGALPEVTVIELRKGPGPALEVESGS